MQCFSLENCFLQNSSHLAACEQTKENLLLIINRKTQHVSEKVLLWQNSDVLTISQATLNIFLAADLWSDMKETKGSIQSHCSNLSTNLKFLNFFFSLQMLTSVLTMRQTSVTPMPHCVPIMRDHMIAVVSAVILVMVKTVQVRCRSLSPSNSVEQRTSCHLVNNRSSHCTSRT